MKVESTKHIVKPPVNHQQKSKYAALGHIDLTSFTNLDFATRKLQSSQKSNAFAEKSRSVIDIPQSLGSLSREGPHLRSFTRMAHLEDPVMLNETVDSHRNQAMYGPGARKAADETTGSALDSSHRFGMIVEEKHSQSQLKFQ